MRPETNVQRQGGRSLPGFSGPLVSSGSLVAPPHPRRGEVRNHIRHSQPQELTVRESGAGPDLARNPGCLAAQMGRLLRREAVGPCRLD